MTETGRCPVGASNRATPRHSANRDWWPSQLDIGVPHLAEFWFEFNSTAELCQRACAMTLRAIVLSASEFR